jgi:hypothetical protein
VADKKHLLYHIPVEVVDEQVAIVWGPGVTIGQTKYPRPFKNSEKFHLAGKGPYMEMPIWRHSSIDRRRALNAWRSSGRRLHLSTGR